MLLLTDRSQLPPGRTLEDTLHRCLEAGAGAVVVRELDLPEPERAALVGLVVAAGAEAIAAHRPAGACDAVLQPLSALPGMHSASRAQRCKRRGASCHSAAEVHAVAGQGVDFATLSPFALTASKPGYGPPLPRSEYDAAAAAGIPVYALGGVTPANAADALAAGASGVAVMGEVMRADDPGAVVRRLLEAVR